MITHQNTVKSEMHLASRLMHENRPVQLRLQSHLAHQFSQKRTVCSRATEQRTDMSKKGATR